MHIVNAVLLLLLCLSPRLFTQTRPPQRPVIIERIEIEGATKTDKAVISRYLTISAGDTISLSRLGRIIESDARRLAQTNFFKEVDYYTRRGTERGNVIVVFDIKERKWPYFQFEGGHNDLDGWFFVPASLRFDNFFGKGNLVGLRFVLGHRVTKLTLGYRNPNIFGRRGFFDAELFGAGQEFINYLGVNRTMQNVDFGGLRVKIGGNDGLFKHFNIGFKSDLGITRFDFSFPLNKVDNEDFQFHVSLGHTF